MRPGPTFPVVNSRGATFLCQEVALPHPRLKSVIPPLLMVGVIQDGVFDWNSEEPIRVVFLLLSPASQADIHVRVLGQLSRLVNNDVLMPQLKNAPDAVAVFQLISERQEKR